MQTMTADVTVEDGSLVFTSSYRRSLVSALKAKIPPEKRKWDGDRKAWLVAPECFDTLAQITQDDLGVTLQRPAVKVGPSQPVLQLFKLDYLGACKDRGDSEPTAFGSVDGEWRLCFTENILRQWFEAGPASPGSKPTLYGVLTVAKGADTQQIRSAYRRLARQWHPDVCKEPDATEQFRTITSAYQILVDPAKRRKYDAGLAFQDSLEPSVSAYSVCTPAYRSPLRCGYLLVEGVESVGRFVVHRIVKWEDIVDDLGRVMVTFWPKGASSFQVKWA